MKNVKNLRDYLQIIQLMTSFFLLYKFSVFQEKITKSLNKGFNSFLDEFNKILTNFNSLTNKVNEFQTQNSTIEDSLYKLNSKAEKILLDQIERNNSLTESLAKVESKIVNFNSDPNLFKLLNKPDYEIHSTNSNFLLYSILLITLIGVSVLSYYWFVPSISSVNFKTMVSELIDRMPGSNTAEGVENLYCIGLTIKTKVIHGQASSVYIDMLTKDEFTTYSDFLEHVGYSITKPENIVTASEVLTKCGYDISALL